jgi:hypothetical protein
MKLATLARSQLSPDSVLQTCKMKMDGVATDARYPPAFAVGTALSTAAATEPMCAKETRWNSSVHSRQRCVTPACVADFAP